MLAEEAEFYENEANRLWETCDCSQYMHKVFQFDRGFKHGISSTIRLTLLIVKSSPAKRFHFLMRNHSRRSGATS